MSTGGSVGSLLKEAHLARIIHLLYILPGFDEITPQPTALKGEETKGYKSFLIASPFHSHYLTGSQFLYLLKTYDIFFQVRAPRVDTVL